MHRSFSVFKEDSHIYRRFASLNNEQAALKQTISMIIWNNPNAIDSDN